jgi:hypothetical protein
MAKRADRTRREAGLQELVSQAKPSNARGGVTCRHGLLRGIAINAVTARTGLIILFMSPALFTPEKQCYSVLILQIFREAVIKER